MDIPIKGRFWFKSIITIFQFVIMQLYKLMAERVLCTYTLSCLDSFQLQCKADLQRCFSFHNLFLQTRYAAILFKKQRYVSGQHKVNLKIICKENYKYEVQEKSPANQAVTSQQLAEEYWR